jgi:hypothetical protein
MNLKQKLLTHKKRTIYGIFVLSFLLSLFFQTPQEKYRQILGKCVSVWNDRDNIASRILGDVNEQQQLSRFGPIKTIIDKGVVIPNQWTGDRGNFVLSSSDQSFRESPSPTANALGTLSCTHRVKPIDTIIVPIDNGRFESWYLVADEKGKVVLGWVPEWGLVFKNQFIKKTEWSFGSMIFFKGQLFAQLTPQPNAGFHLKWKAKGNGILLEGKTTGNFYEYDDLIWAKKHPYEGWEDFFSIDEDGNLQNEIRFQDEAIQVDSAQLDALQQ